MNALLIASALWVLLLPPIKWNDGEQQIWTPKRVMEWEIMEYVESGPACRAFREKQERRYWESFNRMAPRDKGLAKRYFVASSRLGLAKCMPVETMKELIRSQRYEVRGF